MDSPFSSILSTRDERIPYALNLDRIIFFLLLEFHELVLLLLDYIYYESS